MLNVSARSLKFMAALIWYAGAFVLILKAGSLLVEADALRSGQHRSWSAIVAGLLLGGLKTKLLFNKSCTENLDRIATLDRPKLWQFFRPRFFVMLAAMILAGATLSRLAHNNYPFLIGVAVLDLGIASALLGSSYVFWKRRTLHVTNAA